MISSATRKLIAALNVISPWATIRITAAGTARIYRQETFVCEHAVTMLESWTDTKLEQIDWATSHALLRKFTEQGYKFEFLVRTDETCFFWVLRPHKSEWEFFRCNLGLREQDNWCRHLLHNAGIVPLPPLNLQVDEASEVLKALKDRYTDDHPLVQKFTQYLKSGKINE